MCSFAWKCEFYIHFKSVNCRCHQDDKLEYASLVWAVMNTNLFFSLPETHSPFSCLHIQYVTANNSSVFMCLGGWWFPGRISLCLRLGSCWCVVGTGWTQLPSCLFWQRLETQKCCCGCWHSSTTPPIEGTSAPSKP